MTPLVTWKSPICCPYPTSPPFPRKRVPLVLLEWLRKEQNSIFPFIQRMFLSLCSFHVSGRQCYFITVHFPKWLKCPGTHTCGMSHQKCNLALELSSKPATLVIDLALAAPAYFAQNQVSTPGCLGLTSAATGDRR